MNLFRFLRGLVGVDMERLSDVDRYCEEYGDLLHGNRHLNELIVLNQNDTNVK